MHLLTRLLVLTLLCCTVVPGRKSLVWGRHSHRIPTLDVPHCAKSALESEAMAVGCAPSDAPCLCSKPQFFTRLLDGTSKSCTPRKQAAVQAAIESYCHINPVAASTITSVATMTLDATVTRTEVSDSTVTSQMTATRTATSTSTSTSTKMHAIKTSTKTSSTTTSKSKTPTTTTTTTTKPTESFLQPTKGKTEIGNAGHIEASVGAAALFAILLAMGWIFDEF